MSEAKFTRGPWVIDPDGAIVDQHGETIRIRASVSIPLSLSGPIGDEAKPNARLIAAAPELYEALYAYTVMVDAPPAIEERARAALAKARGEA